MGSNVTMTDDVPVEIVAIYACAATASGYILVTASSIGDLVVRVFTIDIEISGRGIALVYRRPG